MPQSPPHSDPEDLVKISPPTQHAKMDHDNDKPHRSPSALKKHSQHSQPAVQDDKMGGVKNIIQVDEVDVQRMVEDTVRRVREQSDRFQAAAKPFADKTRSFAEERPVFFTFLAIFTVLSIIPVSIFVGFVLSATLFFLGVAAVGICLSVLFTILFASSILLPILFFTSLAAISILAFLLTLFLAHRLYMHISASTSSSAGEVAQADYEHLSKGVKSWLNETTDRLPDLPFDMSSLGLGPPEPRRAGDKVAAPGVTVKGEKAHLDKVGRDEVFIKQELDSDRAART